MQSDQGPGPIMRFLVGGRIAHLVHAAAELGVADHMGNAPVSAGSVAKAMAVHEPSLARLLRALATIGIVEEAPDRRYTLTPLGATLRTDQPGSMRARVLMAYHEMSERPWQALPHAVRTGEHAFRYAFGSDLWTYLAAHPDSSKLFDDSQQSNTQGVNAALASSYSFGQFKWIADIGGGNGSLLIPILEQNPALRGTVFELPHVAAQAREKIASAGLSSRCDTVEGSALEGVPAGADAYVLKSVIHAYEDPQAVAILKNCRSVMPRHGKVCVIERVLPDRIDPGDDSGRENIIADIQMMLLPGGRERSEAEYRALFDQAGLRLTRLVPTPGTSVVIEADPV